MVHGLRSSRSMRAAQVIRQSGRPMGRNWRSFRIVPTTVLSACFHRASRFDSLRHRLPATRPRHGHLMGRRLCFYVSRGPAARRGLRWRASRHSGNFLSQTSAARYLENAPTVTAITSGKSPVDPIVQHPGGINARWASDTTLVFLLYRDGFPHAYSLDRPGSGARPKLLTPGPFMVEQMTLSADGRFLIYSANTGANKDDNDRRHLFKVPVDGAAPPTTLTNGTGIEWSPAVTADNQFVAFLASTAQRAPTPSVIPIGGGTPRAIGLNRLPADFPSCATCHAGTCFLPCQRRG